MQKAKLILVALVYLTTLSACTNNMDTASMNNQPTVTGSQQAAQFAAQTY